MQTLGTVFLFFMLIVYLYAKMALKRSLSRKGGRAVRAAKVAISSLHSIASLMQSKCASFLYSSGRGFVLSGALSLPPHQTLLQILFVSHKRKHRELQVIAILSSTGHMHPMLTHVVKIVIWMYVFYLYCRVWQQ